MSIPDASAEALARLNGEARERAWPNLRPADAAALILVDRSGPVPRVLMGKRHAGHKFMPNKFVFPGGRTERSDAGVPVGSELCPEIETALMARTPRGTAARARRLALAAIRETFEETGLVIGTRRGADHRPPAGVWGDFFETGFLPDLGAIHYLARAITPPRRPKRFDTRFFVADAAAIRHRVEGVVHAGSELTELAWLTLAETANQPLPAITRIILQDLGTALQGGLATQGGFATQGGLAAQGGLATGVGVPFYFEVRRQFRRELIG